VLSSSGIAYISKITATTETLSGPVTIVNAALTTGDAYAISASKTLFTDFASNFNACILTDTAGVASVGSMLILTGLTGANGAIVSSSTTIGKVLLGTTSDAIYSLISMDISGTSPTLLNLAQGFCTSYMTPSDRYLRRVGNSLSAGNNVATLGISNNNAEPFVSGNSLTFKTGRADMKSYLFNTGAIAGLINSQSWVANSPYTTALTTGIQLKLMECAA
jgi:hypothetical protein